jgi:hypothetical protein
LSAYVACRRADTSNRIVVPGWESIPGLQTKVYKYGLWLDRPWAPLFIISKPCLGAVNRGYKDCIEQNGIPRDVNESYVLRYHAGHESSNEDGPPT